MWCASLKMTFKQCYFWDHQPRIFTQRCCFFLCFFAQWTTWRAISCMLSLQRTMSVSVVWQEIKGWCGVVARGVECKIHYATRKHQKELQKAMHQAEWNMARDPAAKADFEQAHNALTSHDQKQMDLKILCGYGMWMEEGENQPTTSTRAYSIGKCKCKWHWRKWSMMMVPHTEELTQCLEQHTSSTTPFTAVIPFQKMHRTSCYGTSSIDWIRISWRFSIVKYVWQRLRIFFDQCQSKRQQSWMDSVESSTMHLCWN